MITGDYNYPISTVINTKCSKPLSAVYIVMECIYMLLKSTTRMNALRAA